VKELLRQTFRRLGYNVEGVRYTPRQLLHPALMRALQLDDVLCRHMFEHGRDCVFIQVGAYDGVSTDPLRKYIGSCHWRGVMLEPQPRPAAKLRKLYEDKPDIVILEAAVDGERRSRTIYTVDCEELPVWAGGMASFDRAHLLKHDYLFPGIQAKIRELTVDCVTFDDVLGRLPGAQLDLLQIDAEGADGYLLSLFPFDRLKPAIVHWEAKNMSRADQERALDLLCGHGYLIARSGAEDMLATLAPAGCG
jgi:FkbM family methyltransferase